MTFQITQKTASTKSEMPRTSHLSSRPFAPIIQHSIPTSLQQPEQIERRLQRKTNLLETPLMPPPKKVIQAKLRIGEPEDKYEQEADTVARQVVQCLNAPMSEQTLSIIQRMKDNTLQRSIRRASLRDATRTPTQGHQQEIQTQKTNLLRRPIHRQTMPSQELQPHPIIQRRKHSGNGMTAAPDLEASIQQALGREEVLTDNIRKSVEQGFGDAQSHQLNQSIQAKAFTTGQDVFFRQGESNPDIQLKGSVSNVSSQVVQRVKQEQEEKMDVDSEEPDLSSNHKRSRSQSFGNEQTRKKTKLLNPEQQANKEKLLEYRKKLGTTLNKGGQSITQAQLDALMGKKSRWAGRIESGQIKNITPDDLNQLEGLLKKSQPQLEKLLNDSGLGKLNPEQQANREQLLEYRTKLGKTLNKDNKPITQAELDALMGKKYRWTEQIETGNIQTIAPDEFKRLEELLNKSQPQLKDLLNDSGLGKLNPEQQANQEQLLEYRKKIGKILNKGNKSITQAELDTLMGKMGKKSSWTGRIETGQTQNIASDDLKKLEELLKKSQPQLEKLLNDSGL
ncbi:DUF4157 domain-containing protein, partial [Nostoc sp. NMS4]|uniref:eCIS core domain-containing protein n=1 Tax=Nostoc sp. NMS4 TaxID=2815390 RepID=UPI0025FCA011